MHDGDAQDNDRLCRNSNVIGCFFSFFSSSTLVYRRMHTHIPVSVSFPLVPSLCVVTMHTITDTERQADEKEIVEGEGKKSLSNRGMDV